MMIDVTSPSYDRTVSLVYLFYNLRKYNFNGEIIGTGVDTQKYDINSDKCSLSARYMLQGTDKDGKECGIFIENGLKDQNGWHPMIVTDSECLSTWEDLPLIATVDGTDKGVLVQIFL